MVAEFFQLVLACTVACIGLSVIFMLVSLPRNNVDASKLKSRLEEAASLVNRHIETLARRRIQLIRVGAYGIAETSKWDAEIQRFIDKVIFPELFAKDFAVGKRMLDPLLRNIVEEKSKSRANAIETDLSFAKNMMPQDFERWCTKAISSNGWSASITKATGDQGADVIAEKDGTRLVFQCKLYNTPVGNKAVQEAFAAQHHYRAKASAVVTNAAFTPSAIALAATTGVLLLHYSDLDRLNVLVATSKTEVD